MWNIILLYMSSRILRWNSGKTVYWDKKKYDVPWKWTEWYVCVLYCMAENLHFMDHIISLLSYMEIWKFTRRRKQWKWCDIWICWFSINVYIKECVLTLRMDMVDLMKKDVFFSVLLHTSPYCGEYCKFYACCWSIYNSKF